jgi:ATPase family associated with various cellular activities (AAA)
MRVQFLHYQHFERSLRDVAALYGVSKCCAARWMPAKGHLYPLVQCEHMATRCIARSNACAACGSQCTTSSCEECGLLRVRSRTCMKALWPATPLREFAAKARETAVCTACKISPAFGGGSGAGAEHAMSCTTVHLAPRPGFAGNQYIDSPRTAHQTHTPDTHFTMSSLLRESATLLRDTLAHLCGKCYDSDGPTLTGVRSPLRPCLDGHRILRQHCLAVAGAQNARGLAFAAGVACAVRATLVALSSCEHAVCAGARDTLTSLGSHSMLIGGTVFMLRDAGVRVAAMLRAGSSDDERRDREWNVVILQWWYDLRHGRVRIRLPGAEDRASVQSYVDVWKRDALMGKAAQYAERVDTLLRLVTTLPEGPHEFDANATIEALLARTQYMDPNTRQRLVSSVQTYSLQQLCASAGQQRVLVYLRGEPGVGKTTFARVLAKVMGMPIANLTEGDHGRGLTVSSDSGYYGRVGWERFGTPCGLTKALITLDGRHGMIMFDEVDKCIGRDPFYLLNFLDPARHSMMVHDLGINLPFGRHMVVLTGNKPLPDQALTDRVIEVVMPGFDAFTKRGVADARVATHLECMAVRAEVRERVTALLHEASSAVQEICEQDPSPGLRGVHRAVDAMVARILYEAQRDARMGV